MPTISPRYAFVLAALRYYEQSNNANATWKDARVISMDTQLNDADAQALANDYLAEFGSVKRTIEITVDGVLPIEDFLGAPPIWTLDIPTYGIAGLSGKAVAYSIDDDAQTTMIAVRVGA